MLRLSRAAMCCVVALGCASNDVARPPVPPDCNEPTCNPRSGGGGPGGGGTGSPDGGVDLDATIPPTDDANSDAGTVTVAYTVRQTVDNWFYASANYTGSVNVRAVG